MRGRSMSGGEYSLDVRKTIFGNPKVEIKWHAMDPCGDEQWVNVATFKGYNALHNALIYAMDINIIWNK